LCDIPTKLARPYNIPLFLNVYTGLETHIIIPPIPDVVLLNLALNPMLLRHLLNGFPDQSRSLRSEEHTSELQSRFDLVCRLLLVSLTTSIYTLSLHDALPISLRYPDQVGAPLQYPTLFECLYRIGDSYHYSPNS